MLIKGAIKKILIDFMNSVKDIEQTDIDKSIEAEAENSEEAMYQAIRSLTITIPPGSIVVETTTGPALNLSPIILNDVIT